MEIIKNYIKKLYGIIMTPSMSFLPGNLAFFLVLSLFPFLTLVGVIASKFSINIDAIVNIINRTLPMNIASIIDIYIQGKGFDMNIFIFMAVGFFLASNGAHAIIIASNNLYGFPNSNYVKRRIKGCFIIIVLTLLFIFMLGFLGFGNHLINLIINHIYDKSLAKLIQMLFMILKWPFAIFVIFFNIKMIYTMAPDWKILSKHTTKGALFTTIGWVMVVSIYSFWVTHFSNYDLFYGSMSNIVILMIMIYFLSYIFVIGIAINAKTYEYKIED